MTYYKFISNVLFILLYYFKFYIFCYQIVNSQSYSTWMTVKFIVDKIQWGVESCLEMDYGVTPNYVTIHCVIYMENFWQSDSMKLYILRRKKVPLLLKWLTIFLHMHKNRMFCKFYKDKRSNFTNFFLHTEIS